MSRGAVIVELGASQNIAALPAPRPGNPHVAGNPVGGSAAFVGRDDVLRAVLRALAEPLNQGIVLYGQRRIGKTSILQHLIVTLPERSGHRPVWFDLQDKAASSLDDVLGDLASAIAAALKFPEPAPAPDVESWFSDTWLPSVLEGLPASVSLVLLFDEFDVLADVQAKQAASALFPYLRRLLEKNAPRLRAVFVIGRNIDDLENVAHALFKGLPSCHVSLLARKDAEALVRLAEGNGSLTWSNEAVEAAWNLTHGHPLLLQALCGHVWVRAHEERPAEDAARPVTAAEVEEAVEPTLSGTRAAFEWLWRGLPPGKRIVAAALAQAGPEAISEAALHRVLNENGVRVIIRELRDAPRMLIEWDLVEMPAKGLYQFRVELLRRWISQFKPLDHVQQDLDQIEPTAELLYRAAEALYHTGNLDSAMARLQETLGLNPNHIRASELLADIRISRQEWGEAQTVLGRLYENQPAVARARLVEVLLAQAKAAKDEEEQLRLYLRVCEVENNAVATAGIRQIWKARGDKARADKDLKAALDAYRAGGLAEQQAEISRELGEKTLTPVSPFRSSGALPPGSPVFVGRDAELKFIESSIQKRHSVMIVGGRRIGKTSLLNQVRHRAQQRRDISIYSVDCQGIARSADLVDRLMGRDTTQVPPDVRLERVVEADLQCERIPLFLFNEIDGLLKTEPEMFWRFRALSELGAVFVMVGYAQVIESLRRFDDPLFPFFHGMHYGDRVIALASLTEPPARRLIDLLENSKLALRWRDEDEKRKGYEYLLDESYRIPWLLQYLCHALVEWLESAQRDVIELHDVERVVSMLDHPLWTYIQGLDFNRVGAETPEEIRGAAIQLMLYAVVRQRYFLGYPRPIDNPQWYNQMADVDLSFTVAEARTITLDTLKELLVDSERNAVRSWFDAVDFRRIFWELTLTYVIVSDPADADRFAFQLHILPRELYRRYADEDPTLDLALVKEAANFLRLLNHPTSR